MPSQLGRRVKELRAARYLTQEQLEELTQEAGHHVSVQSIRNIESDRYALPTRRRRDGLAVEHIAAALGEPLVELLSYCSDEELRRSCYAAQLPAITQARRSRQRSRSFADFLEELPKSRDELLAMPGLLSVRNAEAFAVIFALEQSYPGYEALVVNEPPLIFLDAMDLDRWATGMRLAPADRDAFERHFAEYQAYFRERLAAGTKRYKIVLWEQGLRTFIRGKPADLVRAQLSSIREALDNPQFNLVLLQSDHPLVELEVVSEEQEIPADLERTLSVVIRQTSMSHDEVDYCLVPMPPRFIALERDIAAIDTHWALALDQYEQRRLEPRRAAGQSRLVAARTKTLIDRLMERVL